jgi:hypothetical protein
MELGFHVPIFDIDGGTTLTWLASLYEPQPFLPSSLLLSSWLPSPNPCKNSATNRRASPHRIAPTTAASITTAAKM